MQSRGNAARDLDMDWA